MRLQHSFIAAVIAVFLVGCGDKNTTQSTETVASNPKETNISAPVPDVGKLGTETTTAQGFGASAGEAVAEAMKLALLHVNGASVQSSTVSAKYGLDVTLNQDSASLRANSFADVVATRSGGVIQNLKVLELKEPSATNKQFAAKIEAKIAKFTPSADMNKIKVVIGKIQFDRATIPMGDRQLDARDVASVLKQRISDALVQTGRFAILDREESSDIDAELDMIRSGDAPSAEQAKLSQAATADIIWSAKISSLGYNRHARRLNTSDRELVSYSGGWAMTEKLVNIATRQVMGSSALQGSAPSTEPTTLSRGVDSDRIYQDMTNDIAAQVVASVLNRTFPITVVSREGTGVVLSQGGKALKEGGRYQVWTMGKEIKDPQTGQSLGRMESKCCEVVVARVTPNLSYGHLENVTAALDTLPHAALQVREALKSTSAVAPVAVNEDVETLGKATKAVTTKEAAKKVQRAKDYAADSDDNW
jgi:curli biogenesis system outer membrane secretion channel CsgG